MTSVPSHLLPLNGNRNLLILALLSCTIGFFSSCSLFRQSTPEKSEKSTSIPKKEDVKPADKIDTIKWTRVDPLEPEPSIKEPDKSVVAPSGPDKSSYEVAVLLPLYSHMKDKVADNENLKRMLHFYLGMEKAASVKNRGKVNVAFRVIDIESYKDRVDVLLKKDSLASFDAIIGPFKTQDLQKVASYCLKHEKLLISPWNASSNIVDKNPYYIQLKPGLKAHAEAISRHLVEHFPHAEISLVAASTHERERASFSMFTESSAFMSAKDRIAAPKFWLADEKAEVMKPSMFQPYLSGDKTKVFILPYWSNWEFVVNFLNQLLGAKTEDQEVYVFTFPQMIESGKIDYKFFDKLNIHSTYFSFPDLTNNNILSFRRQFIDEYREYPFEEAYLGHDIVQWVSKGLAKHGMEFPKHFSKEYDPDLFTPIVLKPNWGEGPASDDFKGYHYLENVFLNVVRLVDYKFEVVD